MALKTYTIGMLSLLLAGAAHAAPRALDCHSGSAKHDTTTAAVTTNSNVAAVDAASSSSSSSLPGKVQLVPVSSSSSANKQVLHTTNRSAAPRKNLSLAWQTPSQDSLVSVGLTMQNTAVALEDVDDVVAVDCSGNSSVAVTFNTTEAFNDALTQWSRLNDSFVMITNHLGDCDSELERSFFVADSDTLGSFEGNLTIVARAEKSDIVNTASETSIDFNSIAAATGMKKRGIDWSQDTLSIDYDYAIPSDQTIVDTSYVTVVVNEAYVNNSVRYSGHAKWELFKGVTEFYLDVDKSVYHYANMEVDVKGSYTKTWTWAPDALTYSVLDIPGIISLGPSAGVSFGGSVTAAAAGKVSTEFTSQMPNGTIHVDFINWDSSYSSGWETDHDATFNTTESVSLTLKPFVDFTVEFACKLFGGLIDLSTGVKAEPSFPFVTTATTTQLNTTGAVTYPNATDTLACANGLSEDISFQFDVIAFATKWVDITLYEYKHDIWEGCLNYFGKRS